MPNVPPVVVAGMAGVAQVVLARRARSSKNTWALGGFVAGAAMAVAGMAVGTFHQRGTSIDPMEVEQTQTLVADGPYSVTRNPMYVGIAGVLLGYAIARKSTAAVLPVAGFVAVMNTTQIPREERALAHKFGDSYAEYAARVPRWLGRVVTR